MKKIMTVLIALFASMPAFAGNYWTQYTCTLQGNQTEAPTVSIEADVDAQRALSIRILQRGSNNYIPISLVHYENGTAALEGEGVMAVLHDDVSLPAQVYLTDLSLTYTCTHLAGAH